MLIHSLAVAWQPIGQRVLIVEDDPLFGTIVERLLRAADPSSVSEIARDLGSARLMLADTVFDAVLTDVTLPDGSGFTLANELTGGA